jgi:hypothetical protein
MRKQKVRLVIEPDFFSKTDPLFDYFFFLVRDAVPFAFGRLIFLPFTHGPRGLTLIWSSINSFSAAWLGVSKKRLMMWVIPLLHDYVKSAAQSS